MCHWWSSLWVKVKIHICIDGANDFRGYFYLNWDIFFKWNTFKITVMSCSICPGFNVLLWHHAVDTPSTVWFNDWRVVVDSRLQIYSHHHVQHTLKYLHTARCCRFYPYRQPLKHLHCSIYTIMPMPMRQPWRIWVHKPKESNRSHLSNQTKHTKIMCVFYGLYCITGVKFFDGTDFCSLWILRK